MTNPTPTQENQNIDVNVIVGNLSRIYSETIANLTSQLALVQAQLAQISEQANQAVNQAQTYLDLYQKSEQHVAELQAELVTYKKYLDLYQKSEQHVAELQAELATYKTVDDQPHH